MNYLEYTLNTRDSDFDLDVLVALLDEQGYEGFLETEEHLLVYIREDKKDEEGFNRILKGLAPKGTPIAFTCNIIPETNWNAKWESDFQPIEIDSHVKIRASFHPLDPAFRYDLLIDPKMSFGTGHHETTRLMVRAMINKSFSGKTVLDMGCGTGVLAILASKMNALKVVAVDIDEWATTNSLENIRSNQCSNVKVQLGSIGDLSGEKYDALLANINRNILLADMNAYYSILNSSGEAILSGILEQDLEIVLQAAKKSGFHDESVLREKKWCALLLKK